MDVIYNQVSNLGRQIETGTMTVRNSAYLATSSGNVGVGTASPGAKLDIKSPGSGTNTLLRFIDSAGSSNWIFQYVDADGSLRLTPSSSYTFGIASGNLAIGTTTAGSKLDMKSPSSGTNAIWRVMDSAGNIVWTFSYVDSDGSLRVTTGGNYPFFWGGSGGVHPTSDNSAKLGQSGNRWS